MNRKMRKTMGKQLGKDATSTVDLMLSLANECLTCKKPYDKLNKEMAKTWYVEVFNSLKRVDLYCPECQKERQNELSK